MEIPREITPYVQGYVSYNRDVAVFDFAEVMVFKNYKEIGTVRSQKPAPHNKQHFANIKRVKCKSCERDSCDCSRDFNRYFEFRPGSGKGG